MKPRSRQLPKLLIFLALLSAIAVLALNGQAIVDWFKLRGYEVPASISKLATDDTMTAEARHLFYVNRPQLTNGSEFTDNCPKGGEKTVILGCYIGNDGGIYLYKVTDQRLAGIEEVTAAHEMLHAAYRRLSGGEKKRIDALLTNYYKNGLNDERVLSVMESYKKSEPNDLPNEMHSIFATELSTLPAPLETYYKRYFTDRNAVVRYMAAYREEFTSRQTQREAYDARLKQLRPLVDEIDKTLEQQKSALDAQRKQLESHRASNNVAAYNNGVAPYNAAVAAYNSNLAYQKTLIVEYNDIVAARNALALEENQLLKAISAEPIPAQ